MSALAVFMFGFLSRQFEVGVTGAAQLNPELFIYPLLQIVEFGAVALLCNAVCADARTRSVALRVLPLVLLALWARHQFGPVYVEADE